MSLTCHFLAQLQLLSKPNDQLILSTANRDETGTTRTSDRPIPSILAAKPQSYPVFGVSLHEFDKGDRDCHNNGSHVKREVLGTLKMEP
jgi:hypothetical protein